jgi:hypothetical protein
LHRRLQRNHRSRRGTSGLPRLAPVVIMRERMTPRPIGREHDSI